MSPFDLKAGPVSGVLRVAILTMKSVSSTSASYFGFCRSLPVSGGIWNIEALVIGRPEDSARLRSIFRSLCCRRPAE